MKEITVDKAFDLVMTRDVGKCIIHLPQKIKIMDPHKKEKRVKDLPLKFLFNAIRLSNLKHPEVENAPRSVDVSSIVACYLFGSTVNTKYEKITSKYLFGLFSREVQKPILPEDLDILCVVNSNLHNRHIKSMTSWDITISGSYGSHTEKRFGCFDISHIPLSLANSQDHSDIGFLKHVRDHGVCIMGYNVVGTKKYAVWNHDTIADTISCLIPREANITDAEVEKSKEVINRFEMMDVGNEIMDMENE